MRKIIIVLPFLDREKTLDRCLTSIFMAAHSARQTGLLEDIIVIAVDNGSKDSSSQIVRSFKHKCEKGLSIRVIQCEEPGAARARNAGIEYALLHFADNDLLTFVDSDDEIDVCFFSRIMIDWEPGVVLSYVLTPTEKGTTTVDSPEDFLIRLFDNGKLHQNCSLCNRVYPLSLWQDVRIPTIHYCEDMAVLILLLLHSHASVKLITSYCGYFIHKDVPGMTRRKRDNLFYARWLESLYCINNIGIPKTLVRYKNNYLTGYFLELWPRYRFGLTDAFQDAQVEKIGRILGNKRVITCFRPKRLNDWIKKWLCYLFGPVRYRQLFRLIRSLR